MNRAKLILSCLSLVILTHAAPSFAKTESFPVVDSDKVELEWKESTNAYGKGSGGMVVLKIQSRGSESVNRMFSFSTSNSDYEEKKQQFENLQKALDFSRKMKHAVSISITSDQIGYGILRNLSGLTIKTAREENSEVAQVNRILFQVRAANEKLALQASRGSEESNRSSRGSSSTASQIKGKDAGEEAAGVYSVVFAD